MIDKFKDETIPVICRDRKDFRFKDCFIKNIQT